MMRLFGGGGGGEGEGRRRRQEEEEEQGGLVATEEMCAACFDVLLDSFQGGGGGGGGGAGWTAPAGEECPMFVTLKKASGRGDGLELRGCIGTLSARPLSSLTDYAISSAFRDRRFNPLERAELPHITLSVSLLVRYEEGSHYLDWEVGVHGIIIDFVQGGERYNATYLPEVAPEQRWTQEKAVRSLIRKSGYEGRISKALLDDIALTRYQSTKCSLAFLEYARRFREDRGESLVVDGSATAADQRVQTHLY